MRPQMQIEPRDGLKEQASRPIEAFGCLLGAARRQNRSARRFLGAFLEANALAQIADRVDPKLQSAHPAAQRLHPIFPWINFLGQSLYSDLPADRFGFPATRFHHSADLLGYFETAWDVPAVPFGCSVRISGQSGILRAVRSRPDHAIGRFHRGSDASFGRRGPHFAADGCT